MFPRKKKRMKAIIMKIIYI